MILTQTALGSLFTNDKDQELEREGGGREGGTRKP